MITIATISPANEDFLRLIGKLDSELEERYGEMQKKYDLYNFIGEFNTIILAYDDGNAVGCGCFKKFNDESVEIKRMYVQKEFRGRGISKQILAELERLTVDEGYTKALIETGIKQTEAIGLYEVFGYKKIENYGQYAGMDNSICMFKELYNI